MIDFAADIAFQFSAPPSAPDASDHTHLSPKHLSRANRRHTEQNRAHGAAAADHLVAMAAHLATPDARLLTSVYQDGLSTRAIAELQGVAPRRVQRRLRQLVQRIHTPEFAFALAHMTMLEPDTARVARACILQGLSLRAAAATLGLSIHSVRTRREQVLAMARGARAVAEHLRRRTQPTEPAPPAPRSPRVAPDLSVPIAVRRTQGDPPWPPPPPPSQHRMSPSASRSLSPRSA